jgi:hypothetical protein
VLPPLLPVAVAAGADEVMVSEAMQDFWQDSKFALSSEVPLPFGQFEMHSMVWFCAESPSGITMQPARQEGSCGLPVLLRQ